MMNAELGVMTANKNVSMYMEVIFAHVLGDIN